MVIEPLKLDRHPELRDAYFGNYRRLVYLSQTADTALLQRAKSAAERLSLDFEHIHCGYGQLQANLELEIQRWDDDKEDARVLA